MRNALLTWQNHKASNIPTQSGDRVEFSQGAAATSHFYFEFENDPHRSTRNSKGGIYLATPRFIATDKTRFFILDARGPTRGRRLS